MNCASVRRCPGLFKFVGVAFPPRPAALLESLDDGNNCCGERRSRREPSLTPQLHCTTGGERESFRFRKTTGYRGSDNGVSLFRGLGSVHTWWSTPTAASSSRDPRHLVTTRVNVTASCAREPTSIEAHSSSPHRQEQGPKLSLSFLTHHHPQLPPLSLPPSLGGESLCFVILPFEEGGRNGAVSSTSSLSPSLGSEG